MAIRVKKRNRSRYQLRNRQEFDAEGDLVIVRCDGIPYFILDDVHLSELVQYHFRAKRDPDGDAPIGRVKITITPIHE